MVEGVVSCTWESCWFFDSGVVAAGGSSYIVVSSKRWLGTGAGSAHSDLFTGEVEGGVVEVVGVVVVVEVKNYFMKPAENSSLFNKIILKGGTSYLLVSVNMKRDVPMMLSLMKILM